MIRIDRTAAIPPILASRGAARALADRTAYELRPRHYRDGRAAFKADAKLYGHATVKDALLEAQNRKCCYCERKILPTGFGDVEHFRPKGGARAATTATLVKPGYYWLAYDWSNLLVSCSVCNTKYKQNLFPLRDERQRARWHGAQLAREQPLLVDPAAEDPREHIRYDGDSPYALTDRGQATIEVLGLRRGDLREARHDLLDILTSLRATAAKLPPDDEDGVAALAHLERLANPASEFSSMVLDFMVAPFVPPSPVV